MNEESKKHAYIGRVADEFTQENLLIAVEGVDDKAKELVDLSLECKGLSVCH